jgi:hypothetical protein
MVTLQTRKVLMVVFSFTGPQGLEHWVSRASELLRRHCGGEGIETSLLT